MSVVSRAALTYFDAGLTVIPIALDGSKRPIGLWGEWIDERPSRAQIELMFKKQCGIAVLCGPTSGGLECVDFDLPGYFSLFSEVLATIAPGLLDKLTCIQTPRGDGYHLYYRLANASEGNLKLAHDMVDGKKHTAIETRGKGGYAIIPPSPPEAHPSKRPYKHHCGPPLELAPLITDIERALIFDAARSLNKVAEQAPSEKRAQQHNSTSEADRPGDDYNQKASWHDLLSRHGWTVIRERGEVIHWQRPGKSGDGISATTGHCTNNNTGDLFYVFSSNAHPFDSEKAYSKFHAFTLLEHAGDFVAAARALGAAGYGKQSQRSAQWRELAERTDRVFSSPPQDDAPPLEEIPEGYDESAPKPKEEQITAARLEALMDDDPAAVFRPGTFERVVAMRENKAEWALIGDLLRRKKKKAEFAAAVKKHDSSQKRHVNSDGWRARLLYRETKNGDSVLDKCLTNCIEILMHDDAWRGCLALDDFENKITPRTKTPFDRHERKLWSDADVLETKSWLEREYAIRPTTQDVHDAITTVAARQAFNPLTTYLDSLPSSDRDLLDTWLTDVLGAPDTPYTRAVGAKWLIAAVARAYEPGCKVDTVLILEGRQGMKKSRVFEQLCPDIRWFSDGLSDFGTKAQAEEIEGKWIIELAELRGFGRDIDQVKAFVTRRQETYRPAYARNTVIRGRTCVFGGTVNPGANGYLRDETGNRRFWPVKCTQRAVEITPDIRNQLWAEARDRYRAGEHWWLEDETEIESAATEQEDRMQVDPWHDLVASSLLGESEVTINDVFGKLKVDVSKQDNSGAQRIGRILHMLGWERFRGNRGSQRPWMYKKVKTVLLLNTG